MSELTMKGNAPEEKQGGGGSGLIGGIIGGVTGIANMFMTKTMADRQWRREKEGMGLQLQNQKDLNTYNQQLQLDTWNKTNYEAQRKHLEDAGLSVGLMYGQGGAGGATTGNAGGSAAGAHAPTQQGMDMASVINAGLQIQMQKAQIDNLNADTKTKLADAENKGADTGLKGSQKLNTEQDTLNKKAQETGQLTINEINQLSKGDQIEYWKWLANKTVGEAQIASTTGEILYNSKDSIIDKNKYESIGAHLNNIATQTGIDLTKEQIKYFSDTVAQGYINAYANRRNANTNETNADTNLHKQIIDAINQDKSLKLINEKQKQDLAINILGLLVGRIPQVTTSTTNTQQYDSKGNYKGETSTHNKQTRQ